MNNKKRFLTKKTKVKLIKLIKETFDDKKIKK